MTIERRIPTLVLAGSLAATACTDDATSPDAGEATGEPSSSSGMDETDDAPDEGDESGSGESGEQGQCTGGDGRPSARTELEAIWDADRGRMVMFGGDEGTPVMCMNQTSFAADTWAYDPACDEFTLVDDGNGPSARGRYALGHDRAGQRMIVHGGRFRDGTSGDYTLFADTWILDLQTDTWTELGAQDGPSARTNHTAVVAGDQMLLFGGNASTDGAFFAPLGDLWSLDLASGQWAQVPTEGGPGARLFHAAAVSDDGSTMFVYGGGDENAFVGPFFADLWAYDIEAGEWSVLDAGNGGPVPSIWGDLVYDGARRRLLLWGAHEDNQLGNNNKVWAFDLEASTWNLLVEGDVQRTEPNGFCDFPADFVEVDMSVPERRSAGAAVLTDADELMIFGGKTDCGIIDDVWTWSVTDATWTNLVRAKTGEICLRAFAEGCTTMCF